MESLWFRGLYKSPVNYLKSQPITLKGAKVLSIFGGNNFYKKWLSGNLKHLAGY